LILKSYRVVAKRHAGEAFSGEGSCKYPGRFNPLSTYMVYTSESLSMAMLELFVHMPYSKHRDKINSLYCFFPCSFAEGLVKALERKALPPDWDAHPIPVSTRELGRRWLDSAESLILKVPSVVNPVECNYLINPKHPDISKMIIGGPQDLNFDERLIVASGTGGTPDSAR
jgi:RES domain-containing protein